jgi:hypothetical protein
MGMTGNVRGNGKEGGTFGILHAGEYTETAGTVSEEDDMTDKSLPFKDQKLKIELLFTLILYFSHFYVTPTNQMPRFYMYCCFLFIFILT